MAVLCSNGGTGAGEKSEVSHVVMRDQDWVVRWWARALEGERVRAISCSVGSIRWSGGEWDIVAGGARAGQWGSLRFQCYELARLL